MNNLKKNVCLLRKSYCLTPKHASVPLSSTTKLKTIAGKVKNEYEHVRYFMLFVIMTGTTYVILCKKI